MANKAVLSGDLAFLGFADLIQLLGTNASTGTLTLKSKYVPDAGMVYLVNGNPVHAQSGTKSGMEGLMALFGWVEGEFFFTPGQVSVGQTIKKSRNALILDGLQLLDDGQIEKLGPVAYKEKSPGSEDGEPHLPVVRGPLVDYMYVVTEEEFASGKEIIAEGSHGSWVWIVLDGTVEIVKEGPSGKIPLVRLTNGSYIGSLAAFRPGDYVRSASVVAVGNVQLGVMDSQRMAVEFSQMSNNLKALALSLDRRLKQITSISAELKMGRRHLSPELDGQNSVIGPDQTEEGLFIVDQGQAHVISGDKNDRLPLAVLGPSDIFGRLGVLDFGHEPYGAAVYGGEAFSYKAIDAEALEKEFHGLSLAFRNFFENVATCVAATTKLCCQLHRKMVAGAEPATAQPASKSGAKPS